MESDSVDDEKSESDEYSPSPPVKKLGIGDDPYPGETKKKEIIKYYKTGRKRRTFEEMKRKYPKLGSLSTVKKWIGQFNQQGLCCCLFEFKKKTLESLIV